VARLVSVSVGAEIRVTWMFGYCFSNALISTVRASLAPVPLSGLADHEIVVDVVGTAVEPVAEAAGALVVLVPLLPQPAAASAATAASAASRQPRRTHGYLGDLERTIEAPSSEVWWTLPERPSVG
jgi:hypothetical protein